jgi:histidyl-tRNA synthetase
MLLYRGETAKRLAVKLTYQLRAAGIPTLLAFGTRSLKSQLKSANRSQVHYALILGEDELARKEITVRDMTSGEQTAVALSGLLSWARENCR